MPVERDGVFKGVFLSWQFFAGIAGVVAAAVAVNIAPTPVAPPVAQIDTTLVIAKLDTVQTAIRAIGNSLKADKTTSIGGILYNTDNIQLTLDGFSTNVTPAGDDFKRALVTVKDLAGQIKTDANSVQEKQVPSLSKVADQVEEIKRLLIQEPDKQGFMDLFVTPSYAATTRKPLPPQSLPAMLVANLLYIIVGIACTVIIVCLGICTLSSNTTRLKWAQDTLKAVFTFIAGMGTTLLGVALK